MAENVFRYPLTVGLPHTNRNQLTEFLFLMHAGHFQWNSIARMLGTPLSRLRTADGGEVYGTYLYIEEDFPEGLPMNSFRLDDECVFVNVLRAFKNISVDGRIPVSIGSRTSPRARKGSSPGTRTRGRGGPRISAWRTSSSRRREGTNS